MSRIKSILLSITLVCSILWLSACSNGITTGQKTEAESDIVPLVSNTGYFQAEGKVVPSRYTTLSFQSGGEIGSVLVKEGLPVRKGDALVELAKTENLEAALAAAQKAEVDAQQALDDLNEKADVETGLALQAWRAAEKEYVEARQEVNKLDTKKYDDDLGNYEEDVQDAKEDLDDAQEDLNKYLNLDPTNKKRKDAQEDYDKEEEKYLNAVYKRDKHINKLDTLKADMEAFETKMADAKKEYEDKKNGPDPDKLILAEAALKDAKAQVVSAQRALDNATILAPYDGIVVDLFHLTPGSYINSGQSVVQMADFSNFYVETKDLTELDVVKIGTGSLVEVIADAYQDITMHGEVESIKPIYGEYSGDVVYLVRIKLSDPAEGLRWGMTVDTRFEQK